MSSHRIIPHEVPAAPGRGVQPPRRETSTHRRVRREPRAHWLLLVLGLFVLLGELCFNGYVSHVGAEGVGAPPPARGAPAPEDVVGAKPVIAIDPAGKATSRGMPPKTIALTFDDGPDPQWTPQVLDVLARHHAHATFFVVGSQVNANPDLARRIIADGHELGTHTFTHAELATLPPWRRRLELTLAQNAIAGATGQTVQLLRPPYSSEPDAVTDPDYAAMRDAAADGYLTVLSDLDTEDWRKPGVAKIVAAGTPTAGKGAIVLMHDGGGNRAQTVAGLDELLTRLDKQGYKFTTVSEGLDLPAMPAATTGQRLRGQALRIAQVAGESIATVLQWFMGLAIVLTVLRLAVQVILARVHIRRTRTGERWRYMGPISVIVPAYNEAANIAATVRSLIASDYPTFEVIVVDDGSTDGTAGIVERLGLNGVRVLRQENAGKPAALNLGIAHARADLLVLVDGDTVFRPDALVELVQPFADASVGAVSGNTKVANRKGFLGRWQHLEYVIGFNLDRRMFDILECMPTIPGAIGAFRRQALVDAGGVSSQTLAEDTDLTMAILRAGWRVVYAENAIAWTEAPASLRQLWRQRYRWCYGTMQAIWKHRRSLRERGPAGRLGRRGLAYLVLFQILLPLAAPAVDVYALYGFIFLPALKTAAVWLGFVVLQILTAAYALSLDRERWGPLWSLPFQQVVYRQLMYLVVIQSVVTALIGSRLGWQRVPRSGAAQAILAGQR